MNELKYPNCRGSVIPADAPSCILFGYEGDYHPDTMRDLLLLHGGIEAMEEDGCWHIYSDGDFYNGELHQYRWVRDRFASLTLEHAIEMAKVWIKRCGG